MIRCQQQAINQIRAEGVGAVFIKNIRAPRLIQKIPDVGGTKVGDTLYSDALASEGPASSGLEMFRHNLDTLLAALEPKSNTGNQQVQGRDDFRAMPRKIRDLRAQVTLGDTGELRGQHRTGPPFDFEEGHQRLDNRALQSRNETKGHDDPGAQVVEQVALNIQQEGRGGLAGRIGVEVNAKLGHQNVLSPSLKTPCPSSCRL